ncbi:MAG: hypothetical protein ACREV1_14385, partial [Gammaproteobacteria bacterium]
HTPYASENGFRLVKWVGCGLRPTPRRSPGRISTACTLARKVDVTGGFRSGKVAHYLDMLEALYGDGSRVAEGRWLDIGCGHGAFLVALRP